MTLNEYFEKHPEISHVAFAQSVGVSIFAVRKWLSGERIPRDHLKAEIDAVTDGAVQPRDWMTRFAKP